MDLVPNIVGYPARYVVDSKQGSRYIEYNPSDTLRGTFPAVATAPPNLTYWDVRIGLWLTENGETPLTLVLVTALILGCYVAAGAGAAR